MLWWTRLMCLYGCVVCLVARTLQFWMRCAVLHCYRVSVLLSSVIIRWFHVGDERSACIGSHFVAYHHNNKYNPIDQSGAENDDHWSYALKKNSYEIRILIFFKLFISFPMDPTTFPYKLNKLKWRAAIFVAEKKPQSLCIFGTVQFEMAKLTRCSCLASVERENDPK